MQIATQRVENVLVVTPVEKRLDIQVAAAFKRKLVSFIEEGHTRIAVDLVQVNFMDSSCLGALIVGLKRMRIKGSIVLCGANEGIQKTFKLTRIDKIFGIHSSTTDAIAALRALSE